MVFLVIYEISDIFGYVPKKKYRLNWVTQNVVFRGIKVDQVFCGVILYCKTLNSLKFQQDSF